ncbi:MULTISPECIES: YrhB domain-containing protein [unclassified Streptomyces]|uniref:YrhB domain-containing protein n=1 Tax=unclassified Streptomyces TaxID=2593676 RepID=UPI002E338D23|nr:YrhB domain-containing protein [Streptomyces sp. NBC_01477]
MTEEEALAAARAFLRDRYGDGPPTIVIEPAGTAEHRLAWTVAFDSQEHIDTGDFTQAPMVRQLVVFKDGSLIDFTPSALTAEEGLAWCEDGVWPERLSRLTDPRAFGTVWTGTPPAGA